MPDQRTGDTREAEEEEQTELDQTKPRVICTSLTGSKGLSAEHVFVVGMNNGDFPRVPSAIESLEVSQLIVALSRTRKQCHLVSCLRFGAVTKTRSSFIGWLGDLVQHKKINKDYW